MPDIEKNSPLFSAIRDIVNQARQQAYRSSNTLLLHMYWEIGRLIVEDEQRGSAKAAYGKAVLKNLARALTVEFGVGFDERNLNNMRAFYQAFPIWNAVRTELSWTHYRILSRIDDQNLRQTLAVYAIEGGWDTRTLQRNIQTQYVGRVLQPPKENEAGQVRHLVKDPYIFEFLGIPAHARLTENKLETALITHLQQFLMELGKGFAFVARQQHVVTDTADLYVDLVFYNYYLKCFVLIDLKTGKLSHAAIGQMDMYVRMDNDLKRATTTTPPLGLSCAPKRTRRL